MEDKENQPSKIERIANGVTVGSTIISIAGMFYSSYGLIAENSAIFEKGLYYCVVPLVIALLSAGYSAEKEILRKPKNNIHNSYSITFNSRE